MNRSFKKSYILIIAVYIVHNTASVRTSIHCDSNSRNVDVVYLFACLLNRNTTEAVRHHRSTVQLAVFILYWSSSRAKTKKKKNLKKKARARARTQSHTTASRVQIVHATTENTTYMFTHFYCYFFFFRSRIKHEINIVDGETKIMIPTRHQRNKMRRATPTLNITWRTLPLSPKSNCYRSHRVSPSVHVRLPFFFYYNIRYSFFSHYFSVFFFLLLFLSSSRVAFLFFRSFLIKQSNARRSSCGR